MRRLSSLSIILVVLFVLLAGAAVAFAASSSTLLGYQVDYLGFTNNVNGTSTWTYAVTSSGDEANGLSHWTLGIGGCYLPVATPGNNAFYTTPTSAEFGCGSTYNCQAATCKVVHGKDPTTGVTGIKFEDCSPQLDKSNAPRTHIFQFTLSDTGAAPEDVPVATKAGNKTSTGMITGPSCKPTAVAVMSMTAEPMVSWQVRLALVLFASTVGLIGAWYTWKRMRA